MLSEDLKRKIAEAVAANRFSTQEDLLLDTELAVTISPTYDAYFNLRITGLLDEATSHVVTHVRFVPLADEGVVVVQAAKDGDKGAVPFQRSETGRSGTVNMRAALRRMKLQWSDGRNLKLPATPDTIPVKGGDPVQVLVLTAKAAEHVQRTKRPRKKNSQQPPQADDVASSDQTE